MAIHLSIAKQFSETPGPRFREEGDFSGEQFRDELLEPEFLEACKSCQQLMIDLDGTAGYATSFLEEAFGGLARKHEASEILKAITLVCDDEPGLIEEIKNYIRDAKMKRFAPARR